MNEVKKDSILQAIFNKKMLITLFLGFASGLPLLLTGGTLKTWLKREGVDISMIGYFSWVGMAYSLKFFWAPAIDSLNIIPRFGRRKFWLVISQICIAASFVIMGLLSPKDHLGIVAAMAVVIAFFGATQDVVIDAYRREYLEDRELGLGSSMSMYGYRIAMLVSGGLAIGMVADEAHPDRMSWGQMYWVMGILMLIILIVSFFIPEPKSEISVQRPSLQEAFIQPFAEFLKRKGAFLILIFIFMFKLGDALSGAMLQPFYIDMGYSNQDIAVIAKTFGLASSLVGLFLGGIIIYKVGIFKSLVVFGILQALSTATFALITYTGPQQWSLAVAVIFEDVSSGMGSAAFVAFIAKLCNKRYTGTQYALLSSLATLGRNFFSGFTGKMQISLGWANFYYACALIAIPGLIMLFYMKKFDTDEEA